MTMISAVYSAREGDNVIEMVGNLMGWQPGPTRFHGLLTASVLHLLVPMDTSHMLTGHSRVLGVSGELQFSQAHILVVLAVAVRW